MSIEEESKKLSKEKEGDVKGINDSQVNRRKRKYKMLHFWTRP